MSLPSVIEVVSPSLPLQAQVTIPGSKSITNRALCLAAMANGRTVLSGALWSEDTQVMVNCLRTLGAEISVAADGGEPANRTITVAGGAETASNQVCELFVGNSGTTARFLAAFLCVRRGFFRLSGVPRMHERPQAALFAALRELGYRVDAPNDKLPAVIHGSGPRPGAKCRVAIEESSQFASALLLAATQGKWEVSIEGEDVEEASYVRMTRQLIGQFPAAGGAFQIEPDASSASYFWGAGWLFKDSPGSEVRVQNFPEHLRLKSLQVDARFPDFIDPFAATISRRADLADSIMTAIVLAPFALAPITFAELGRLRLQECERVRALHTELKKCGAFVSEEGDILKIAPGPLRGAEIETYGDHRMAMCFAILGLRVPGIRIKNPEVVNKTFPNFWEKLVGLGVALKGSS